MLLLIKTKHKNTVEQINYYCQVCRPKLKLDLKYNKKNLKSKDNGSVVFTHLTRIRGSDWKQYFLQKQTYKNNIKAKYGGLNIWKVEEKAHGYYSCTLDISNILIVIYVLWLEWMNEWLHYLILLLYI